MTNNNLNKPDLFNEIKVFDVVLSGELCNCCQEDVLGIVVRLDYNEFVRQPAATIVYQNGQFTEVYPDNLNDEFKLTQFHTNLLDGLDFSDDNLISDSIKRKVFDKVFKRIIESLNKLNEESVDNG